MDFWSYDTGNIPASAKVSRFRGQSGVEEYHIIVRPTEYGNITTQLEWVNQAYQNLLDSAGLSKETAIFRRFFCSDLLNQSAVLKSHPLSGSGKSNETCAVSWISQPPIPPVKVALWAYHLHDPNDTSRMKRSGFPDAPDAKSYILKREKLSHHWTTGMTCLDGTTHYDQTRGIFEKYNAMLKKQNMSLAENVIRTWFFVQNIDANYNGLVVARREFFAKHGLTPDTHFIASTGIEGSYVDVRAKVTMDAYAISGVQPEQIQYLAAPEHLSPTHVYGVTFERGTSVEYADRKQIYISGTASIDHKGKILYPGDVQKQLDRTLENVEALLKKAGAVLEDMGVLIVYLRDPSDFDKVGHLLRERVGDMPMEIIVAPVCRPGWLIEIEGQATIPASNSNLPAF